MCGAEGDGVCEWGWCVCVCVELSVVLSIASVCESVRLWSLLSVVHVLMCVCVCAT